MTANEVAYAGVLAEEQKNQELRRHNTAQEDIERAKTELENIKSLREQEWHQRANDIAAESNRIQEAYNTASIDEKIRYDSLTIGLQQESNRITQERNEMENAWKTRENEIKTIQAQESVRHNQEMESLTKTQNDIANKKVETEFLVSKRQLIQNWRMGVRNLALQSWRNVTEATNNWLQHVDRVLSSNTQLKSAWMNAQATMQAAHMRAQAQVNSTVIHETAETVRDIIPWSGIFRAKTPAEKLFKH